MSLPDILKFKCSCGADLKLGTDRHTLISEREVNWITEHTSHGIVQVVKEANFGFKEDSVPAKMLYCIHCCHPLIVAPFIEHGPPSPIRVVFDFYCAKCTNRGIDGYMQQLPYLDPDKIYEPFEDCSYDEYHYATKEAKNFLEDTTHKFIIKRKTGLATDYHPLPKARLLQPGEHFSTRRCSLE